MIAIPKRAAAAVLAAALALSLAGCGSTQASDSEAPTAMEGPASAAALDATYSFGAIAVPIQLGWTASPNSDGSVVSFNVEEGGVYLMRFDISSKLESENAETVLREEIEASFPDEAGSDNLEIEALQKASASDGAVPAVSYRAEAAGDTAGRAAVGEAYVVGSDLYRVQCVYTEGAGELESIAEAIVSGTVVTGEAESPGDGLKKREGVTQDEVKGGEAFVIHEGLFYDATLDDYWIDGGMGSVLEQIAKLKETEAGDYIRQYEPAVLDRATGDEIALFVDAEECTFYRIIDEGYCRWEQGNRSLAYYDSIEEVEGVAVSSGDEFAAELSKLGIEKTADSQGPFYSSYWLADEPVEFTIGWYKGTDFVEGEYAIDEAYCLLCSKDEAVTVPVEKTKSGYFVVNASSLKPGDYLFEYDGSNVRKSTSGVLTVI